MLNAPTSEWPGNGFRMILRLETGLDAPCRAVGGLPGVLGHQIQTNERRRIARGKISGVREKKR